MKEIVAQSCENLLSSKALEAELRKTNPELHGKIRDFVKKFVARLRAAVQGMTGSLHSNARTLYNETEKIAELWLGARQEALNKTAEGPVAEAGPESVSYATEELDNVVVTNGIEKGMSDAERYAKLKGSKITTYNAAGKISINELSMFDNANYIGDAEELFTGIAERNGILHKNLDNKYIKGLNVEFSKKGVAETVHHQDNAGYINLAALMPVFEKTFYNAIPVMIQDDRYLHVLKDKTGVKTYIQMLGAFRYVNQAIPV